MDNENKDKVIKDAQYRKGLSIAFFNATNNATEFVKAFYPKEMLEKIDDIEGKQALIKTWRDWLLEEHKNYYANVIAQVGNNFDPKETIEKLKSTKTVNELGVMWRSLSQDERDNNEIIECVKTLKVEYEKQK